MKLNDESLKVSIHSDDGTKKLLLPCCPCAPFEEYISSMGTEPVSPTREAFARLKGDTSKLRAHS